jgi:transposase-like protein
MAKRGEKIRHFSEAFKKEKVKMYEEGKLTAIQIQRLYDVSESAVYKWIDKYCTLPKGEKVVVQKESEAEKTLTMMERLKELERALGSAHLRLFYAEEVITQADKELRLDLKKKYEDKLRKL